MFSCFNLNSLKTSVRHSNEDLNASGSNAILCNVCNNATSISAHLIKTNCGHAFHKTFIKRHVQTSNSCPVCMTVLINPSLTNTPSKHSDHSHGTRSQTKKLSVAEPQRVISENQLNLSNPSILDIAPSAQGLIPEMQPNLANASSLETSSRRVVE